MLTKGDFSESCARVHLLNEFVIDHMVYRIATSIMRRRNTMAAAMPI